MIFRLPLRSLFLAALLLPSAFAAESGKGVRILCTTFPVRQIVLNVAAGAAGAQVDLLVPAALGCPHDYALAPRDMAKAASADVIVANGLGMEEFLGGMLDMLSPRPKVVVASAGIGDILMYGGEEWSGHPADRDIPNPHLFASPAMTALLAENIGRGLAEADPANRDRYVQNAEAYAAKMRALAEEMAGVGRAAANRRVVAPDGIFDYLLRDLGLATVAFMQSHESELSAAGMLELVKAIRERKPALILAEPQLPERTAETLKAETGVDVLRLDPGDAGRDDAPAGHYEAVMRGNMAALAKALAGR